MKDMDNGKIANDVAMELVNSKKKRKAVTESLKKWATGEYTIYDQNGKRISGEPLVSYRNNLTN